MIEEKEEIWKTINEFPNYQVSSLGIVKSLKFGKERILKPFKNKKGYLIVALYNKRKRKIITIHRLVASAFVQNDSLFKNEINHIDEDKTNNCAENLEWCDSQYNLNYGTRNERVSKSNTNNPKRSKAVKCIETGKIYPSAREIERQFGFANQTISDCCLGKLKSAHKLHWEFV